MNSPRALYPPSPGNLPRLAVVTGAYRLRVVIVLGSLFLFLFLYLGLVAGSAYLTYWTAMELPTPRGRGALAKLGAIVGAAMLFFFFLKGLFKGKRWDTDAYVSVGQKDEPRLFEFLSRLCTEGGSAFPRRVYLSHEVNAAVFYPRSLFSLVWPIRKNLLIGLGLVNALNLSELKAVLAHEFGHFAQSSMKLGQYVYVANQVIGDMVFGRDYWDWLLEKWRGLDVRLSFPAWILSGIVWLLRSFLAAVFRGINLLNLSLMRQMEFNADLHAVRLAGSDALISGLWKSERASLAFQMALSDLASLAQHKKYSDDVFFHQAESLRRLDGVLAKAQDADGRMQDLKRPYRCSQEIHFKSTTEPAAAMWQTHPSTREREMNAKRVYVPAAQVEEPAWALLDSAPALRKELSKKAYQECLRTLLMLQDETLPAEEVQRLILEEREEVKQADHYFGFYDDRIVSPGDVQPLAAEVQRRETEGGLDTARLREEAVAFSGESLKRLMAEWKEKEAAWEKRGDQEQVQKEREAFYRRLGEGDRAVFRYFYWKSGASEKRGQLLARYRFMLQVQEEIKLLNALETELGAVVNFLQSGKKLSEDQAAAIVAIFNRAWGSLGTLAARCERLMLPRLSHMEEGKSVRSFILPETLVPEPSRDQLSGAWIGRFLEQFHQVLGRLRRLHFKNLGLLLKLQESLDPEFHGVTAPAVVHSR